MGGVEAGITLQAPAVPAEVENNTVTGYESGIWVKHQGGAAGHDVGPDNVLRFNTDGVRVGFGDVANGTVYSRIHDNTITNNTNGVNSSTASYWDPRGWTELYAAHANLTDNEIANNTVGVLVRAWVLTDTPHVLASHANLTRNRIHNNSDSGAYFQGTVYNGTLYRVWGNVSDNNTFADNPYGVWIDGDTVDPNSGRFRMWWNDVRDSSTEGAHIEGDPFLRWGIYHNARCNWWNGTDSSPPNNLGPRYTSPLPPDLNVDGTGLPISNYVHYRNWLNGASLKLSTTCGQD